MKKLNFDYSTAKDFINEYELDFMNRQVSAMADYLVGKTGPGKDFLGWIDLPVDYDKAEFERIKKSAEKIKNEADIPTGAVGLITSGEQAEEILQTHKADLIFLGRLLLRNPYFPLQYAMAQKETIFMPHQYLRGKI